MINKKLTKLVGLKKEDFDNFIMSNQIHVQPAQLIPLYKTGDEMALTSIFLSALRLVKEYRDDLFKQFNLSRSGRVFYYVEASFKDIDSSRIDGLIIVVSKGVIKDAAFFEMKNKNNRIDKTQIDTYLNIAKQLKVSKLITVSNEFVSDPTKSPISTRVPKNVSLLHFSWTYLLTKGQLLLFSNDDNIEDVDQVEIMKEVLNYTENPVSGVSGYTQMKPGWKELAESVRAQKPLKISDQYIEDAVLSWYEEEKDMAMLMSRKLGVLVKASSNSKNRLKDDIKRIVKQNYVSTNLAIKNSVSDIKVTAEFERRIVLMSIRITPPQDKRTKTKVSWLYKQIQNCEKRSDSVFESLKDRIWIEANVKFARENVKVKLSEIAELSELSKDKEIQAFRVVLIQGFGAKFASPKKFIELIEQMILDYYEGIVQHMKNWEKPAPRLEQNINP